MATLIKNRESVLDEFSLLFWQGWLVHLIKASRLMTLLNPTQEVNNQ
jgi:hypothetical protein